MTPPGPFFVEFACPPWACLDFLQVLRYTDQNMHVRLNGNSSLNVWRQAVSLLNFRLHFKLNMNDSSPSLLLTLANTGPWLLDSWEELLKDDGGRLATSGLSHTSVNQSHSRKKININVWHNESLYQTYNVQLCSSLCYCWRAWTKIYFNFSLLERLNMNY